jgi:hypothetical protein
MEAGTQFIGIKPEINMAERKSNVANNPTDVFTIEDIAEAVQGLAPYMVYTALLTQTGGDAPDQADNFPLVLGRTYQIMNNSGGADFTIAGAPNNEVGTYFAATSSTVNWGNDSASVSWNEGAPVVTVLENTVGDVWFTYEGIGIYSAFLPNSFDTNKMFLSIGSEVNKGLPFYGNTIELDDPFSITNNTINFFTYSILVTDGALTDQLEDGQLVLKPIEIRVYN